MRNDFVTRSRTILLLLAVVAMLALPAPAANSANNGVIEGRVINESAGRPRAHIEVNLTSALPDGSDALTRRSTTDDRGRYAFEDLPTGEGRTYALSVDYKGGLFTGEPVDELGQSTRRAVVKGTLRIWETISNPDAVLIQRHNIFVSQGEGGLGVLEAVTLVNTTDRAYIGRARSFGLEEGRASMAFALPSQATDGRMLTESDFFGTPIAPTDSGFGLTVAIPPGTRRVLFAYTLPGAAGNYDLSRTALYPTLATAVFATDGLTVDSNRLSDAGNVTIGNTAYQRWSSDEVVEAGEAIQVSATAEAGTSGWLAAAAIAAVLAAGGIFVLAVARNRRPGAVRASPEPAPRHALVEEIAALDLRHETGRVDDGEWTERRAELKQRLAELSVPE
jgi:hypothetical protein